MYTSAGKATVKQAREKSNKTLTNKLKSCTIKKRRNVKLHNLVTYAYQMSETLDRVSDRKKGNIQAERSEARSYKQKEKEE